MTDTRDNMKSRPFGKTGRTVSEVGFGAWAIGDAWGPLVEEDTAVQALHAALADGVDFLDTADVYGAGRSEQLIARALKDYAPGRDAVFLATKTGRGPGWSADYETMARSIEDSADRLGVNVIDLVQLHCIPTDLLLDGGVFEVLERIKDQGLIRHYGASVETIEEGLHCVRHSGCASLQVIYNIFRQRLNDQLLPEAHKNGVAIIARVPLASGLLTGKYQEDHDFPEDDHRNFNANGEKFNVGETFAGVPFEQGVKFSRRVADLAREHGLTAPLSQIALRWVLDQEEVTTVIPGAKDRRQAHENSRSAKLPPLPAEFHEALRTLYREEIDPTVRGAY
jgi:aryl-alcohol dehydrogenase-like predicted oxidoreductase